MGNPFKPHFKIVDCPAALMAGGKLMICPVCKGVGKKCVSLEPDKYRVHPQTGEKLPLVNLSEPVTCQDICQRAECRVDSS